MAEGLVFWDCRAGMDNWQNWQNGSYGLGTIMVTVEQKVPQVSSCSDENLMKTKSPEF